MKFLEPQIIKREGSKIVPEAKWILKEISGDRYYLKDYKTFGQLHLAQELGGNYCILDNKRCSTEGFIYNRLEQIGKYIIAFWWEEMPNDFKKQRFLVLEKSGYVQLYDSIEVIKYELRQDIMLITSQNGIHVFRNGVIQCFKKVSFITISGTEVWEPQTRDIAIIKLAHNGDLYIEDKKSSKCFFKDVQDYELWQKQFEREENKVSYQNFHMVKIVLKLNSKLCNITSFEVNRKGEMLRENLMSVHKINFMELSQNHTICNWCEKSARHILCKAPDGTKVVYDLWRELQIQTDENVHEIEVGKEIYLKEESGNYVRVYDKQTSQLLLKTNMKILEPLNLNPHKNQEKWNIWIGEDEKRMYLLSRDEKLEIPKILAWQALDNYLLLQSETDSVIYQISDEIRLIAQNYDANSIYCGTKDIIVVKQGKCYMVYYNGIFLKRCFRMPIYEECHKKWDKLVQRGQFIKIPYVGEFFVNCNENKAYGKLSMRYWREICHKKAQDSL